MLKGKWALVTGATAGLGLAVARGLVEAHGGRLTAQRRGGGGTIFTFTLPLEAPVPATR